VSLLFKQVVSALFLLVGLIISLSWYEWKDSPIWMLFLGGFIALFCVIGVVLNIAQAEEELSKD
jgi:predicted lysophospholipase L1 biosynthesis ABC-type transport system permease subunit